MRSGLGNKSLRRRNPDSMSETVWLAGCPATFQDLGLFERLIECIGLHAPFQLRTLYLECWPPNSIKCSYEAFLKRLLTF